MKAIIDRFEGIYAVCELNDKSIVNIEKSRIPEGAVEGTVISIEDVISIDETETSLRKERIKKKMDSMWE
jgi:hypothetical protein